jgi:hypothetical protein
MNRRRRFLIALILATTTQGVVVGAEQEFVALFDGETLDGWTIQSKGRDANTASSLFSVVDGAILIDSSGEKKGPDAWLVSNEDFDNFVLRMQLQIDRDGPKGNSGVQIRSRYQRGRMVGPQIDIHPGGPRRTGMVYSMTPGAGGWFFNKPPSPEQFKFFYANEGDGWNDLEITADGTKLKAVLNGVTVMAWDGSAVLDNEVHRKFDVGMSGILAFQIHGGQEVRIRVKNIRIKRL